MAQIVPDEGLFAVLNIIQANGDTMKLILDTVNSAPAAGDTYAAVVQPGDANLAGQAVSLPVSTGVSGAEQYTYTPVIFGPPAVALVETVYAWCVIVFNPADDPKLLFRRQLPTPFDCNQTTIALTITPSVGAAAA